MSARPALVLLLAALALPASALEVNSASQAELEQLRGVGVALSDRLLAERAAQPFADWADLMRRVPGIAARQARRLSEQGLTVAGRRYAGDNPPPASAPISESK